MRTAQLQFDTGFLLARTDTIEFRPIESDSFFQLPINALETQQLNKKESFPNSKGRIYFVLSSFLFSSFRNRSSVVFEVPRSNPKALSHSE
jgi:hypothetical protein